jgi:hypothetical protein
MIDFFNHFWNYPLFWIIYTVFGTRIGARYLVSRPVFTLSKTMPILLLCGPVFWALYGMRVVLLIIEVLLNIVV